MRQATLIASLPRVSVAASAWERVGRLGEFEGVVDLYGSVPSSSSAGDAAEVVGGRRGDDVGPARAVSGGAVRRGDARRRP